MGTKIKRERVMSRNNYQNQIALGWVSMLLVLILMLLIMTVFSALDDDAFSALRKDPGRGGLRMMTYVVGIYALMPVMTYMIEATRSAALRWLMAAFAVGNIFFMLLHHLSHWHSGDRPNLNSHFLDLVYHLLGLWVLYCSIQWARKVKDANSAA